MLHQVRQLFIHSRRSQNIFSVSFLNLFFIISFFFLCVPHASHFLELWIGIILGFVSLWTVGKVGMK